MDHVVFSARYDMGLLGLERLHPFDARKYGRAWKLLRDQVPAEAWIRPDRPVSTDELLTVHTPGYLERLRQPRVVAQVLELGVAALLPRWLLDRALLRPMRWATRGTVLAVACALERGFAVNLGGGFHHATPDGGEGFCVYADVALAIHAARAAGQLSPDATVVHLDLDAHLGNGVAHCFLDDPRVRLFDVFNGRIYPCHDRVALARVDHPVPVDQHTSEVSYLARLRDELPRFLDAQGGVGLAVYNAGTDVFAGDPLGGLNLSGAAIAERDAWVVSELRRRGIPTAVVPSGGYTRESHRLIASSVAGWLGGAQAGEGSASGTSILRQTASA